jgi:alpha-1,3-rhamnosyl/mannosyltransferase
MATWTGVGRYTTGLARALARIEGVEITQVIAAGEKPPVAPGDPAADAAVGACAVPDPIPTSKHPFALGGGRELGRIAREVAPDLTHCAHFPTPLPAPHPLVVTMHDLSPLLVPGIMPSAARRAAYRWWNGRAVRVADRIITDATFTVGEIERVFPRAVGRITPIPLGVDDFASGPIGPLPEPQVMMSGTPYLLSMGSTRSHKDLPTLLSAFAAIAPERPELWLLLVGADEPGYIARSLADASPEIRERVAFTGRVDDGTLRALMAGAAAFVFPSRYEGFGLPPLEAMALGTPAVVSDAASLLEVVGDAALTFAPGDVARLAVRLEALLADDRLRERHSAAGLMRARELTWSKTAAATLAVYREVTGGS